VGFEPTVTSKATTVFETAPIVHSGTPPRWSPAPRAGGVTYGAGIIAWLSDALKRTRAAESGFSATVLPQRGQRGGRAPIFCNALNRPLHARQ
jgi:hypothetical protein